MNPVNPREVFRQAASETLIVYVSKVLTKEHAVDRLEGAHFFTAHEEIAEHIRKINLTANVMLSVFRELITIAEAANLLGLDVDVFQHALMEWEQESIEIVQRYRESLKNGPSQPPFDPRNN